MVPVSHLIIQPIATPRTGSNRKPSRPRTINPMKFRSHVYNSLFAIISRGSTSTSTPRKRRTWMRWCPSIIVPSSLVFRQSLWPGTNEFINASLESRCNWASLAGLREVSGWSALSAGYGSGLDISTVPTGHFCLLHHAPSRIVPQQRGGEEQGINSVKHAAVTRKQRPRILDSCAPLDQRFHKIAQLGRDIDGRGKQDGRPQRSFHQRE